jgi:hypothetical protein
MTDPASLSPAQPEIEGWMCMGRCPARHRGGKAAQNYRSWTDQPIFTPPPIPGFEEEEEE